MAGVTGGRKFSILPIVVLSLCINLITVPLVWALWSFLRAAYREQARRDITAKLSQSRREAIGYLLQR